jgi:hypothetical protein
MRFGGGEFSTGIDIAPEVKRIENVLDSSRLRCGNSTPSKKSRNVGQLQHRNYEAKVLPTRPAVREQRQAKISARTCSVSADGSGVATVLDVQTPGFPATESKP